MLAAPGTKAGGAVRAGVGVAGRAAVAGLLVPMLLQHNKNDNNNGKHNDNKQDMHDYVNVGYI